MKKGERKSQRKEKRQTHECYTKTNRETKT